MTLLLIDGGISLGNILTALSVLVSAIALLISWSKDRKLKRKEYADRIRNAVGLVMARLERRKELSLHFFEYIQPILVSADQMLLKERDVIVVRDYLWRELVAAHATILERIAAEQIEVAYKDLYGYDIAIQQLYTGAVERLKTIDTCSFWQVLHKTQVDVLSLNGAETIAGSAVLGNILRTTIREMSRQAAEMIDSIIEPFRAEMSKVIQAKDGVVFNKQVKIAAHKDVLPNLPESFTTYDTVIPLYQDFLASAKESLSFALKKMRLENPAGVIALSCASRIRTKTETGRVPEIEEEEEKLDPILYALRAAKALEYNAQRLHLLPKANPITEESLVGGFIS